MPLDLFALLIEAYNLQATCAVFICKSHSVVIANYKLYFWYKFVYSVIEKLDDML